jgi:acetyl-CoA acetyltransferase
MTSGTRTTQAWQRDKYAIVGIGATDFSRRSGRSELTLATQAAVAALADAGLSPSDVDGIIRCDYDAVRPHALAAALGVTDLSYWADAGPGGNAPCAMIGHAIGAIASGQASTVLAFRALNGRSGQRYGLSGPSNRRVGGDGSYDELAKPFGLLVAGQAYALIAQRHMSEFGTTSEQLAEIPLVCRRRANSNPAAQMQDRTLTLSDYLNARMIATPLRLFDFCLETDGACAVVVTSLDRAKDCRQRPVLISAVAQAAGPNPQPGLDISALMRPEITTLPARDVAATLYARAGVGPTDIDVAQFYDCFSITVLIQLEDYGFCAKGEGGAFAASGALEPGGALPINTSGGNLSEGYIHGMSHIVEAVRQLRGQSTSQAIGAETCLVTSTALPPGSAMVLRSS